MAEHGTTGTTAHRRGSGRRFPLSAFLMALFLAFAVSSGMVGFLLGRNAARSSGELVDTIVLSPGDSSLRSQSTLHFLSGKLLRQDGSACEGVTVRLDDANRSDVTDEQGKFYLSDVRSGEHVLEVLDDGGTALASAGLTLDFTGTESISSGTAGETPAFHMPAETRLLELTLTVGENDALTIEEDSACFVTKDGQVVDFSGSALRVAEGSSAITLGGNLVAPTGSVIFPSKGILVTYRGEQTRVQEEEEILPGTVAQPDGTFLLQAGAEETPPDGSSSREENGGAAGSEQSAENGGEDSSAVSSGEGSRPVKENHPQGILLFPNGEIELPDGETLGGDGKVVVVENGGAEELEALPDHYTPAEEASLPTSSEPAPKDADEQESQASEALGQLTSEPAPTDPGMDVSVVHEATGISWRQDSFIDLFASENRTDSMNLGEDENGLPLAAPGSSGSYEFRLKNAEDYDIYYTISFRECSMHLPIRYSVLNAVTEKSFLYRQRIKEGDTLVSPRIRIPAGKEQTFRIDWKWDYEDWYDAQRDNALDMAGAMAENNTYEVGVSIQATQILSGVPLEPDGDIRYPGKR